MSRTIQEVVEELERFESADLLAAYFQEHEFYGVVANGDSCPVANYITEKADRSVVVSPDNVVALHILSGEPTWVEVPLGVDGPLRTFILLFDEGEYPELEDDYDS